MGTDRTVTREGDDHAAGGRTPVANRSSENVLRGSCADGLRDVLDHEGNALVVTTSRTPSRIVEKYNISNHSGGSVSVLNVTEEWEVEQVPSGVTVVDIEPGAMQRLGCEAVSVAESWDPEAPSVACLGSLTPLVRETGVETVFRWLHAMRNAFESVGASVHAHVDPSATSGETIALIEEALATTTGDERIEQGKSGDGRRVTSTGRRD
ncbi:MAG: hypothetical protein ABEH35_00875 [Haloarculaceae archaeon]